MRKSRKYQPGQAESFELSRSKLENFLTCARCFYIDRRLGAEPPGGPPFTINMAVDHLLKKEFDRYRETGTAHPYMAENGIDAIPFADPRLDAWRDVRKGVRVAHEGSGFSFYGAVDDLWIDRRTQEIYVVDYKATAKDAQVSLDEAWQIAYKRQVEIYQWLLRKQGLKVSDTAYFVYCNGDRSAESFGGAMRFKISLLSYRGSDLWVEKALVDAKQCLEGGVPEPTLGCKQCVYCADIRALCV